MAVLFAFTLFSCSSNEVEAEPEAKEIAFVSGRSSGFESIQQAADFAKDNSRHYNSYKTITVAPGSIVTEQELTISGISITLDLTDSTWNRTF